MPLVWVPTETDQDPTTTIAAPGVSIGDDEVIVTDTASMPPVGYIGWAVIDDEVITVTGAADNPYPIERARAGTVEADHAALAPFNWIVVPETIVALVKELALDDIEATIASLTATLALKANDSEVLHNSGAEFASGTKTLGDAPQVPGGSGAVAGIGVGAPNYGVSKSGVSVLLVTNGTPALTVSPTVVSMGAGRTLQGTDAILSRLRLSTDYVRDGWAGQLYTAMPNTGIAMSIEVDADPPSPSYYPRSAVINRGQANEEYIVCIAAPVFDSGTGLWTLSARRAMPFNGATKFVHDPGETFEWTDNSSVMHGFVLPNLTGPGIVSMIQAYTADVHDPIQIFTPPRGTWNGWAAPLAGYLGGIAREALPSALQLLEPLNATVLGEIPANERGTLIANYNAAAFDYYPFVATSHA